MYTKDGFIEIFKNLVKSEKIILLYHKNNYKGRLNCLI